MKIVSLLPSATEIICAIGLREPLVGVSHECDYPDSVKGLPVVTRSLIPAGLASADIDQQVRTQLQDSQALYTLNLDVLKKLQPDLIVTQALCDVCAVSATEVAAAACQLSSNPCLVNLEPASLGEVFQTMLLVGEAAACQQQAALAVEALQQRVNAVTERSKLHLKDCDMPRVAMLEWLDPLFNAGHWTPELVGMAGGNDCLGNIYQASTTTPWDTFLKAQAQVIFIALCGFDTRRSLQDLPLIQSRPGWADIPAVLSGRVYCCDGSSYFSRSGPRLVDSLEILAHSLHPRIHPLPQGLSAATLIKQTAGVTQ